MARVTLSSTNYISYFRATSTPVKPSAPTDADKTGWHENFILPRPAKPYIWWALNTGSNYAVSDLPMAISNDEPE